MEGSLGVGWNAEEINKQISPKYICAFTQVLKVDIIKSNLVQVHVFMNNKHIPKE